MSKNDPPEDLFVNDFVAAIGKNKKFDNEQAKVDFALDVYEELHMAISTGEDRKKVHKLHQELLNSSKTARDSVIHLWNAIMENRKSMKSISPISGFLSTQITDQYDIDEIIYRLDSYHSKLSQVKLPKKKRGKNNVTEYLVASILAKKYLQYLQHKPYTGKADTVDSKQVTKIKKSPYDRICDLIEEHWALEISIPTRRKAIQSLES